jgi:hypothetical protein
LGRIRTTRCTVASKRRRRQPTSLRVKPGGTRLVGKPDPDSGGPMAWPGSVVDTVATGWWPRRKRSDDGPQCGDWRSWCWWHSPSLAPGSTTAAPSRSAWPSRCPCSGPARCWPPAEVAEQVRGLEQGNAAARSRAAVARELHDVVAHHVSLIAVRAATATYQVKGLSAWAQEACRDRRRSSRRAGGAAHRARGAAGARGCAATGTPAVAGGPAGIGGSDDDVATGSLDFGLPVAVGVAPAGPKLDRVDYRVWVQLPSTFPCGSIPKVKRV